MFCLCVVLVEWVGGSKRLLLIRERDIGGWVGGQGTHTDTGG